MKFNALRDGGVALCLLLLLLLIAARIDGGGTETFTGRYRIVDGDSLALGKIRFRLLGIDAPELSQSCSRRGATWPCGMAAKQELLALAGGDIACKGSHRDRYGRLLVTCFDGSLNINRAMVLRGMAINFGGYETEEKTARDLHAGLWAGDFSKPADWRRTHGASFDDDASHMPSLLRWIFGVEEG